MRSVASRPRRDAELAAEMKILHVTPALAEEASGPSYTVRRTCESLVEVGHDVTLAALDWGPLSAPPAFLRMFPLGAGPRRLGRSPAMNRWLHVACSSGDVEIIHNHGMWQMNAIYPAWAARAGDVPLVWSPRGCFSKWAMRHGSFYKKPFWRLLQHPALRRTACFHATAESEYLDIRRLGFRQPVCVIPNGIDLPPLCEREPAASRTLLFLGRIHVVKGLENLVHAWARVEAGFPEWSLRIVGGDDGYHGSDGHLEALRSRVRDLAVRRVEFVPGRYGEAKFREYRNADLYVLPSFSENFGVTVAESLTMETPVITTHGTPWGGLEQQAAGWWIGIGADPLEQCLREALSRPPQVLAEMGRHGRSWMSREYAWPQIADRLADVYAWVVDRSRPEPPTIRLD
jgi:glycosyltransferase involved in cell wall biosynthesis